MEGCAPIKEPPGFSTFSAAGQADALANYIVTLYGDYADCISRNEALVNWINDNVE